MPIKDMPVTNKQHAVPQNIMDVEFKLIGDLTMRQFAYLFIFGGIAWGAFIGVGGIFKWPIVITAILLGIGLAFVPLEDRGLDQWIINFFKSVYSPTQKVWRKDPQVPLAFTYQSLAVLKQELITLAPTSSRRKLEEYLEYQGKDNTNLDKYDIAEQEYIRKVKDAFGDTAYSASVTTEVIETPTFINAGPVSAPTPAPIPAPMPLLPPTPPMPPEEPAKTTPTLPSSTTPNVAPVTVQPMPAQVPIQTPVRAPAPATAPVKRVTFQPKKSRSDISLSPITPDRHSGRRFVSLLPKQGQIVLPIRGEKVLKTSEELDIETDIQEKTEQLQILINQIKKGEGLTKRRPEPAAAPAVSAPTPVAKPVVAQMPPKEIPVVAPAPQVLPQGPKIEVTPPVLGQKPEINNETQSVIENIKAENARLAKEIEKLKSELSQSAQSDQEKQQKAQTLQQLEIEKSKTKDYYDALQTKVQELQTKITEKEKIEAPLGTPAASTLPISNKPNIVSGIVKDPDGVAVDGAVVIIKDSNNEPKRAIKTNILGQFNLATPLSDGSYLIEVINSDKMNYSFGIISVEAKGVPIPPLELVGKR